MNRKIIPARELKIAPWRFFLLAETSPDRAKKQQNDSFHAKTWTTDSVDLEKMKHIHFAKVDDLIDKIEGWDISYLSDKQSKWYSLNLPENHLTAGRYWRRWNKGYANNLIDYMSKNFISTKIIDNTHPYYDQRVMVSDHIFHRDLNKSAELFRRIESSDPRYLPPVAERNQLHDLWFARHVTQLYKTYIKFKTSGWDNSISVPVLEHNGDYITIDKCTVAPLAGFADIDIQIDVVAKLIV